MAANQMTIIIESLPLSYLWSLHSRSNSMRSKRIRCMFGLAVEVLVCKPSAQNSYNNNQTHCCSALDCRRTKKYQWKIFNSLRCRHNCNQHAERQSQVEFLNKRYFDIRSSSYIHFAHIRRRRMPWRRINNPISISIFSLLGIHFQSLSNQKKIPAKNSKCCRIQMCNNQKWK